MDHRNPHVLFMDNQNSLRVPKTARIIMDGGRIAPHDRARVSRIGGRGGTLPRRHPKAGGDHHPVPGPGQ